MPLTTTQYRMLHEIQQVLVEKGWHPAIAGQAIMRAVNNLGLDAGMGKVQQLRRIRHDEPGDPPRIVIAGEQ